MRLGCAFRLATIGALLATTINGSAAATPRLAVPDPRIPVSFEPNVGQSADPAVRFVAHLGGGTAFLTDADLVLTRADLPDDVVRLTLEGANPAPRVSAAQQLPGVSNYLVGESPTDWHTGIANYACVEYANVLPGVDLVYRGDAGQLEYDFNLAAGADPGAIKLGVYGAQDVTLGDGGDLTIRTAHTTFVEKRPTAYQQVDGAWQQVDASFALAKTGQLGFQLGAHDRARPLVIDPVIGYSTLLGGAHNDMAFGIAVDAAGSAYVTGATNSPTFPGVGPGSLQPVNAGSFDVFVTKLNPAGTAIVYSTFLGGGGTDQAHGIAVDPQGNAYITGQTDSTTFPGVGPRSIQSATPSATKVGFVTKLNPVGNGIVYSTFLGSASGDGGFAIAADAAGNVYVTGQTGAASFPGVGPGSIQSTNAGHIDAFVTKINPDGSGIVYSTFLGGSATDQGFAIAVDPQGAAYVTGDTGSSDFPGVPPSPTVVSDAFVTKINPSGSAVVYSRRLGGGGGTTSAGNGIAADADGNAYITGFTRAPTFTGVGPQSIQPTHVSSAGSGFVTKINADGSAITYSTFLGGANGTTSAQSIAVDAQHNAYVTGWTSAFTFPGAGAGSIQPSSPSGHDAFFTRINVAGTAIGYSTFLGGRSTSSRSSSARPTSPAQSCADVCTWPQAALPTSG